MADTGSVERLLGAILADTPHLPGATCKSDPKLWDGSTPEDAELAAWACAHSCPVFQRCRAWILDPPDTRPPPGVVAGLIT